MHPDAPDAFEPPLSKKLSPQIFQFDGWQTFSSSSFLRTFFVVAVTVSNLLILTRSQRFTRPVTAYISPHQKYHLP
jgi:hypothetical protein